MVTRFFPVAVLSAMLLLLFGCNDSGDNFFAGQNGGAGGSASLDIAGTYSAVPEKFGFNLFTIYQSGSSLTASDNGGGTWSGTLANVIREERSGTGGTTVFVWRGDVTLNGQNTVNDKLSLVGSVEITVTLTQNVVIITASYENVSIGLTGQVVLTQVTAVPGGVAGAAGGGGSSGAWNQ
jgi:hypothetical protein